MRPCGSELWQHRTSQGSHLAEPQHASQAVREAVSIPVLANGNIQHLRDAYDLMAYTGAAGVMSAESLLDDPALFSPARMSGDCPCLPHLGSLAKRSAIGQSVPHVPEHLQQRASHMSCCS